MKLSDKDKVSIVTGICLFGLVVVLKNVLLVPAETQPFFSMLRHPVTSLLPTALCQGSTSCLLAWLLMHPTEQ
jgi:hypothetical protein